MPIVTPTFNLNGNCEQALTLYQKAFDAEIKTLLRYSDADKRDWTRPLTDEQRNMIYHAELFIGTQRVFFSDIIEFDVSKGNSLFLAITFENTENVKKAYKFLKNGSKIITPMKSTTYSSCFVSLVDRFGFRWVLFTEEQSED